LGKWKEFNVINPDSIAKLWEMAHPTPDGGEKPVHRFGGKVDDGA
jgi:hypothetical protein